MTADFDFGIIVQASQTDNSIEQKTYIQSIQPKSVNYGKIVRKLQESFKSGRTLSYNLRIKQLKNLQRMLVENATELCDALFQDLRRPLLEAKVELTHIEYEVSEAIRNLHKWMEIKKRPFNLLLPCDKCFTVPEPYGVVLIIGAWNYPINVTMNPLIGAIAAGNCVIIKPPEQSHYTASKIAQLIPLYLDQECYQVVEGTGAETAELLKQKFDYIFSTGSNAIGRHVMAAAAVNLTPVTLELGGKNPVYIDDSADLNLSIKRILWGKLVNMGQACVAPDYILCSKAVEDSFVKMTAELIFEWYGSDAQSSADLCRIGSYYHTQRLKSLLNITKGRIVYGGHVDLKELWISPTLVEVDVEPTDILMESEIFGPILPFLRVDSPTEALQFINRTNAKPLAIYVFSKDDSVIDSFVKLTSSGGLLVNDISLHSGWPGGIPFGGVGASGMGKYHGKYSFKTFSHEKSVLHRSFTFIAEKPLGILRYPPYNNVEVKTKLFSNLLKQHYRFDFSNPFKIMHVFLICLGMILMHIFNVFNN